LLNRKDLLTLLPSRGGATFSGFAGPLKRGEADLLIPQGLLADRRRRMGEGLLNLKGLLTAFPPSFARLFENERVVKPHFRAETHQIPPFSAKKVQIMAENEGFSSNDLGQKQASGVVVWSEQL